MTKPAADETAGRRGRASRKRRAGRLPVPQPAVPSEVRAPGRGGADPFKAIGGSDCPDFNAVLVRELLGTVWVPAGDPNDGAMHQSMAAAAAVRAFKPRDEVEAMIAAQAAALHFGAMEALRCSMLPDQPSEVASRLRKDGASLCRAMAEMVEALDRRRGKGTRQVVRVERVGVQEGGQAIVGAVAPPAGTEGTGGRGEGRGG